MVDLIRHNYRYFPYELELARREAEALFPHASIFDTDRGVNLLGNIDKAAIDRLVYFSGASDHEKHRRTMQSQLENIQGGRNSRQSTRYSAHGLHEYKGKFNPQIVRAILNILDIPIGSKIIDPFCGSGTSLLECAHQGMNAVGVDINPLAVFIANAKVEALGISADEFRKDLDKIVRRNKLEATHFDKKNTDRETYLLSWFTPRIYREIEHVRLAIEELEPRTAQPFLAVASNLLRDYSLQDPKDLRVRRRKSPLPEKPFLIAFQEAALDFIGKISAVQDVIGTYSSSNTAILSDSTHTAAAYIDQDTKFDCALTSPPYATALPYIDTQRLSLVWLGLTEPTDLRALEAELVGSREIRGASSRSVLTEKLKNNSENLPIAQASYCLHLQQSLGSDDGFRRQAMPLLLYRYFASMAKSFKALHPLMKENAPFALIVGVNHTVLGGQRFDINTPQHLAEISEYCGWSHEETIPLQTYQRYGYHMHNAVTTEAMVIVRAK